MTTITTYLHVFIFSLLSFSNNLLFIFHFSNAMKKPKH